MDTDFIGFSYGGINSRDFDLYRVSISNRYEEQLIPQFNENKTAVPGGDGTYFFDANYTQRQFKVSFAFDSLTETQYRQLRLWLGNKDTFKQLIFDERPYKYYMAKPSAPPTLKTICFDEMRNNEMMRIYKGEGEVTFVCYYPFARSIYKYLGQYNPPILPVLTVYGRPISSASFTQFRLSITDTDSRNTDGDYYWEGNQWYLVDSSPREALVKTDTYQISDPRCGDSGWNLHYQLETGQIIYKDNLTRTFIQFVIMNNDLGERTIYLKSQTESSSINYMSANHFRGDTRYCTPGVMTEITDPEDTTEYTDLIVKDNNDVIYSSGAIFKERPTVGSREYRYSKLLEAWWNSIEGAYWYDIELGSKHYPITKLEELAPYYSQLFEWQDSTQMYNTSNIIVNLTSINLDTLVNNNSNKTSKIYLYNAGDFSTYFQLLLKKLPVRISLVIPNSAPIIVTEFNNGANLPDNNTLLIDTKTQLIQLGFGSITNFTPVQMVNSWASIQNYVTIPVTPEQYTSVSEIPYLYIEWPQDMQSIPSDICEIQYNYLYF